MTSTAPNITVHPALTGAVRRIDVVAAAPAPSSHTVLPGVCPVAGFQLDGGMGVVERAGWRPLSVGGVTGLMTGPRRFTAERGTATVLVTLEPWSLPLLFGEPAFRLTDGHVSLDDLAPGAASFFDQIRGAGAAAGARRIQRFLLTLLRRRALEPDVAVRASARALARGEARIEALAERLGLSRRQLERRFLASVGVSPKTFAALARFRRAERALRRGASPIDAAASAGYYDQSHLTNEFRRFSGLTPAVLR